MNLTIKQQRFADEFIIIEDLKRRVSAARTEATRINAEFDLRLFAAKRLAYRYFNWPDLISDELADECIAVIKSPATRREQRKAARIILMLKFGATKTNDIIEKYAIVSDRSDALVKRWRNHVLERDKQCVFCGAKEQLQAHHVSEWAVDPVNRINVDNGITLCGRCHAGEHRDMADELFVKRRG